MNKYSVELNGRDMLIRVEKGELKKHGFYTSRLVEAPDEETAELMAVDLLKAEYREVLSNTKDDPPVVYVEEIVELESFGDNPVPGEGAAWYPEDSDE